MSKEDESFDVLTLGGLRRLARALEVMGKARQANPLPFQAVTRVELPPNHGILQGIAWGGESANSSRLLSL